MPSTLETTIEGFYADLEASEEKAFGRIAVAHKRAIDGLGGQLDTVIAKIADDTAKGIDPGTYPLQQARLASLITQADGYFQEFGSSLGLTLTQAQQETVDLAKQFTPSTVIAQNGDIPSSGFSFATLPEPAIQQFVGTLGDGSPLRTLTDSFGKEAATDLNRIMLQGVALGTNPLEVARQMKAAVPGIGINRARTIARTEMMRAFREGNRRVMQANKDILKGWRWHSSLDRRTCPVCWAMHGREFKLSASMATHPNCRCVQLPISYTWRELGFDVDDLKPDYRIVTPGEDLFAQLDEPLKRAILGKGGYLAWSNKLVTLDDFVQDTYSAAWGYGRTTKSLRAMVGSQNARDLSRGILPSNLNPSTYRIQLPEVGDPLIRQKTQLADWVADGKLYQSEADDILKLIDSGQLVDPGDVEAAIEATYNTAYGKFSQAAKEARSLDIITMDEYNNLIDDALNGVLKRQDLDDTADNLNTLITQKKSQIQHEFDLAKQNAIGELDKAKAYGNITDTEYDFLTNQINNGVLSKDDLNVLETHYGTLNKANNPLTKFEKSLDDAYNVGAVDDVTYQLFKSDLAKGKVPVSDAPSLTQYFDDLYQKNKPIKDPWLEAPDAWSQIEALYNQKKLTYSEYAAILDDVKLGKYNPAKLKTFADDLEQKLANKVTKSSQQLLDELNATHLPYPQKQKLISDYKAKLINKEEMQQAIDDAWINYPHPPATAPNPYVTPKVAIPDPADLTKVSNLGGSTGAELHSDIYGNRFVVKRGSSPGHLLEESIADDLYDIMGVPVPEHQVFGTANPTKVARFIDGKSLNSLTGTERAAAEAALRQRFASDALLGNWDVIGLNEDNILVDAFGKVYRIDNGGSLRYRAMGGKKAPNQWTGTVDELATMRDPSKTSGKIFGSLTDNEIADQIQSFIVPNRTKLLARVANDPDLYNTLSQRIDYLEDWAKNVKAAAAPKPQTTKIWATADDAWQAAKDAYYNGSLAYKDYKAIQKVYWNIGSTNPWGKFVDADYFENYVAKKLGLKKPSKVPAKSLPYAKHVKSLDDLVQQGIMTQTEVDDIYQKYAAGKLKNKDIEAIIDHKKIKAGQQSSYVPGTANYQEIYDTWKNWDDYGYYKTGGRGERDYKAWHATASREHRDIVQQYTGSLYRDLNKWNRYGRPDQATWQAMGNYSNVDDLRRYTDIMDDAMSTIRISEDLVVVRNSRASVRHAKAWADPQVGSIIWDDGYMSTSTEKNWSGFSSCSDSDYTAFQLILLLPKGSNALFAKPISSFSSENEIIIPRAAKLEVVHVEDIGSGYCKQKRIFARLIG